MLRLLQQPQAPLRNIGLTFLSAAFSPLHITEKTYRVQVAGGLQVRAQGETASFKRNSLTLESYASRSSSTATGTSRPVCWPLRTLTSSQGVPAWRLA